MSNMINLIPEKFKKRMRARKRADSIIAAQYFFCFCAFIFLAGMIFIYINLQAELNFQKIVAQNAGQGSAAASQLEEKTKELNAQAQKVKLLLEKQKSQVSIIEKIFSTLVPGIKIVNVSIKGENGIFNIMLFGNALNSDALYDFRSKLTHEEEFSKLVFPDNLLLAENEINFDIRFEYKALK